MRHDWEYVATGGAVDLCDIGRQSWDSGLCVCVCVREKVQGLG